jgi:chaperone modulatory protein CbpM
MGDSSDRKAMLVIDETTEITLDDLVSYCHVRREKVVELVAEGIIEPVGRAEPQWRFGGPALRRARKAVRLERDLEINLNAVALILDLLDEIETLKARTREG